LLFLQEQIKDIIIISTRVKHEGRCDVTRFTHLVTSHCHRRHGRARRGGAQLICGARSPRGVDGRAEGSMIDACVCVFFLADSKKDRPRIAHASSAGGLAK
jgi:hypothetical protein